MNDIITIYTDGSCKGNPGPGGWAALLRYNKHEKMIWGSEPDTTNNRMELTAAIKALAALTKKKCKVTLITDSDYLKNGITKWIYNWEKNNWKTANRKPVKNVDLWQMLFELVKKHDIKWQWIKAHAGHFENEKVDEYAKKAIDELEDK